MALSQDRIIYLLEVYTAQKATPREEQELLEWMLHSEGDSALKAYVQQQWEHSRSGQVADDVKWDAVFDRVMAEGRKAPATGRSRRIAMKWYYAAASVAGLMILCAGFYFAGFKKHNPAMATGQHDVKAPQVNRATITLSSGKTVYLDSMDSGAVATLGNVHVIKLGDGKIAYKGAASREEFNVLENPRGSKVVDITLADGTHIWLNAGSSLRYPVAFTGKERKVSITGEAYFEVTPDAAKPFKVTLPAINGPGGEITVLGTHFNVNAYDDESVIKTTLLEGCVRIDRSADREEVKLRPGQEARMAAKMEVADGVNVEEVMAWKNDRFAFGETADITTIMRQLARWYDIDVSYEGKINVHFSGAIPRTFSVSEVLRLLESTGSLKFRITGRKVTVIPV